MAGIDVGCRTRSCFPVRTSNISFGIWHLTSVILVRMHCQVLVSGWRAGMRIGGRSRRGGRSSGLPAHFLVNDSTFAAWMRCATAATPPASC